MNAFHNHSLKKRFERENPGIGADMVDWSITGKEEDYNENVETMKEEYPQYNWGMEPNYDEYAKDWIKKEADKHGLTVNNYNATKKTERLETENHRLRGQIVKDKTMKLVNINKAVNIEEFWETIEADIHQTHIIINAKRGHGKSSMVKSIIYELKRRDPKLICKCFDVSFAWWDNAPLKHRQMVTPDNWANVFNQDNCLYEMGDLTEETRRLFVSLIVKQDYAVRRKIREMYGEEGLKKMPFILYILEESDTYFDSASLNKKDDASAILRDFIKVGRNFGLCALCIVTASTGELGTKLRRRSNDLIGRIVSDEDLRGYNRKRKGLGNAALEIQRFNWLYYNGKKLLGPLSIEPVYFGVPDVKPVEPKAVVELKIKLEDKPKSVPHSEGGGFMQIVFWLMVVALVLSFLFFR